MTRREQAIQYFIDGYNCSQAIVLTFSDLLDIDQKDLLKLASSFGGGMGRLREVCGAVSGMFIVAGLLYGYETPETGEIKKMHYARIQDLAHAFEAKRGTLICRDLLQLHVQHDSPEPSARTPEFFNGRPCPGIIGDAAEILEKYIEEHGVKTRE